jgi:hypothetical protein
VRGHAQIIPGILFFSARVRLFNYLDIYGWVEEGFLFLAWFMRLKNVAPYQTFSAYLGSKKLTLKIHEELT